MEHDETVKYVILDCVKEKAGDMKKTYELKLDWEVALKLSKKLLRDGLRQPRS